MRYEIPHPALVLAATVRTRISSVYGSVETDTFPQPNPYSAVRFGHRPLSLRKFSIQASRVCSVSSLSLISGTDIMAVAVLIDIRNTVMNTDPATSASASVEAFMSFNLQLVWRAVFLEYKFIVGETGYIKTFDMVSASEHE